MWILGTTNAVSFDIWGSLKTLYPILLIAVGLTLFIRKESHWIRVAVWVLVFAAIGGYAVYLGNNVAGMPSGSKIFEMVDGMDNARLEVSTVSANLRIGSADTGLATVDTDISGLRYNFSGGKSSNIRYYQELGLLGSKGGKNFTANLNSTITWNLELNTGTTDGVLDFSNLMVNNCNINTAACDMDIIAGKRWKSTNIQLNAASADINITIPVGSGIRIEASGVSNDVRGEGISLSRNGNSYQSENYGTAQNIIILKINSVSTTVNVKAD